MRHSHSETHALLATFKLPHYRDCHRLACNRAIEAFYSSNEPETNRQQTTLVVTFNPPNVYTSHTPINIHMLALTGSRYQSSHKDRFASFAQPMTQTGMVFPAQPPQHQVCSCCNSKLRKARRPMKFSSVLHKLRQICCDNNAIASSQQLPTGCFC